MIGDVLKAYIIPVLNAHMTVIKFLVITFDTVLPQFICKNSCPCLQVKFILPGFTTGKCIMIMVGADNNPFTHCFENFNGMLN